MPLPGDPEDAASRDRRRREELVAILGALSFFLSAIEYTLPKPLPFMRLGIANLPILLAVDLLPLPSFLVLVLIKFVGMSLVSGTLFSYVALFSLAGSLAAGLTMRVAGRLGGGAIGMVGISILGAMASAAVQISLARYLIFGEAAIVITPLFFTMSLATGTALGLFAARFARGSSWYEGVCGPRTDWAGVTTSVVAERPVDTSNSRMKESAMYQAGGSESRAREARRLRAEAWDRRFPPGPLALTGAIVALSLLFQPLLPIKALLALLLFGAAFQSGRRISLVATIGVTASIVVAGLAIPVGRILFHLGPFLVTETALLEGLGKAFVFQGLLFVSKATIRPGLRLPGRFGSRLADAFLRYEGIVEFGGRIRPRSLVADIDALLIHLARPRTDEEDPATPPAHGGRYLPVLGIAAVFALGLLVAGLFASR